MYRKIIVALDGSKLAEQVLPIARLLADASDAGVELVQAVGGTAPAAEEEAVRYLAGAAQRYAFARERVSPVAESGEAAEIIVDRAKGDRSALIAMTTHGRTGAGCWLLGSVAEKVVHYSRDPVLILRAG